MSAANFRHAKSRQPEIIRSVQKDSTYTNILGGHFLDLLRLVSFRQWIKHSGKSKCIAEILYHSFASVNNLQTLGEEYTGIIQINSNFTSLPPKFVQLFSITLEFGAEFVLKTVLEKLSHIIVDKQIDSQSKVRVKEVFNLLTESIQLLKALHKTIFYVYADKYQIAKRVSGINYVTIKHWVKLDQPLYGYHILGWTSFIHILMTVLINSYEVWRQFFFKAERFPEKYLKVDTRNGRQCVLCQRSRFNASLTQCGHLFCLICLTQWLSESNECPICRDYIKKSNVIQLRNYI